MTLAQRLLDRLGAHQLQVFRRWVGGRWTRRFAIRPMEWCGAPIDRWRLTPPAMWTALNLRVFVERVGPEVHKVRCTIGDVEFWPTCLPADWPTARVVVHGIPCTTCGESADIGCGCPGGG